VAITSNGLGNTLTAAGSAHAKGAWAELFASTPEDTRGMFVATSSWSDDGKHLVDVGVGAAGSEVVAVADMVCSACENVGFVAIGVNGLNFYLPVGIASGSRVAARTQCSVASRQIYRMKLQLVGGTLGGSAYSYGAAGGSSSGVTIDPGGTANVKGSYSEIAAATSAAHDWVAVSVSGRANLSPQAAGFSPDIAAGAGGAEVPIMEHLAHRFHLFSAALCPNCFCVPIDIASGTRLSARGACSITDASDRLTEVGLVCVTGGDQ
jgi:hypothetical protein